MVNTEYHYSGNYRSKQEHMLIYVKVPYILTFGNESNDPVL